jgi:octaprenyl-diphosphate synthase
MAFGKIGQKLTAIEIFDMVRTDLDQVEREIGLESIASVEALTSIGQYLQSGGGKRLRPILVLLCGKLCGPATRLIRIAAVMEMIHTATLVHDDVMTKIPAAGVLDQRGVGQPYVVLAGDWLYMQAFHVALRERSFHPDALISLTQMMVEGELLQLERIGKIGVTEADYMGDRPENRQPVFQLRALGAWRQAGKKPRPA